MKIRRINLIDGNYIRVGDFATECNPTKAFEVTEVEESFDTRLINGENQHGYALLSNDKMLAFIPFHAVTVVFMEVENES